MIGVDTNVLVRFLVRDDEKQADHARQLFSQGSVFIPKTVMLETEWVLRFTYGLSREIVADALEKVTRMQGITVEDTGAVGQAISWHGSGLNFADALHLASSGDVDEFKTFDRDLQRKAADAGSIPVSEP